MLLNLWKLENKGDVWRLTEMFGDLRRSREINKDVGRLTDMLLEAVMLIAFLLIALDHSVV